MKKQGAASLPTALLGLVVCLVAGLGGCTTLDVDETVAAVVARHRGLVPAGLRTGDHSEEVKQRRDQETTLPHVWAIYDDHSELINEPLADLQAVLTAHAKPFTDVYVISHGWNFTTQSGIRNYERFLHNLSTKRELMAHAMGQDFRPLVVCVSWASVSQPVQSLSASTLPQGLDHVVRPFAKYLDEPFHLLSSWNESNRALLAAVGHIDERGERWGQPGGKLNYGVGALVARICDEQRVERVHVVGHSYGAKLIALSAVKAMHGEHASDKLQSLVLFNPAFHPRELIYDVRGMDKADIAPALRRIPTKAIVYSTWDSATGSIFGASQIVGNAAWIQWLRDEVDDMPCSTVRYATGALAWIGGIGVSMFDWLVYSAYYLPFDWWHHVSTNDSFGEPGFWTGTLNAAHFFLPLDALWRPVDADKLGLFRPTYAALGRTGLDRHSAGRPAHHPLLPFLGEDSACDSRDFLEMAAHIHLREPRDVPEFENPERIFSFDASDVFDSWGLFGGSHGDLREHDVVATVTEAGKADYVLQKIDCTVNFVFNLTTARRRFAGKGSGN